MIKGVIFHTTFIGKSIAIIDLNSLCWYNGL